MGKLDFQNPQAGVRTIGEIAQVAGLVDRVRKVADAMALDIQIQTPTERGRALLRKVV